MILKNVTSGPVAVSALRNALGDIVYGVCIGSHLLLPFPTPMDPLSFCLHPRAVTTSNVQIHPQSPFHYSSCCSQLGGTPFQLCVCHLV